MTSKVFKLLCPPSTDDSYMEGKGYGTPVTGLHVCCDPEDLAVGYRIEGRTEYQLQDYSGSTAYGKIAVLVARLPEQ